MHSLLHVLHGAPPQRAHGLSKCTPPALHPQEKRTLASMATALQQQQQQQQQGS